MPNLIPSASAKTPWSGRWRHIEFAKRAVKDAKRLKAAGLDRKVKTLIEVVRADPFAKPPAYEPLVSNLSGYYSRRISIQHRFVY